MKAVIYARYSSDNQREESIEGQLRECKAYAEYNGIELIGTYIDRAYSAKTDNRPEFQKMIKDSYKGVFDIIIVWKLDRFARNRYDSARYKHVLKKNGVKVLSATETIADGSEGILLESVLEGMAEYYSAELAEKVKRGMTDNALKAKANGVHPPFGYYVDKTDHYQIDETLAPIVKEIFILYRDGKKVKDIITIMNERGVLNKNNPLGYNSVFRMLTNRKYIGEYKFGDVVLPDGMPAIIDEELFNEVQSRMKRVKKAPAMHRSDDDYILTSKLFCGKCGALMTGEIGTSHTQAKYRYYKCNRAKKKDCKKKTVKKDWLEDQVIDSIVELLKDDQLLEQLAKRIYEMQQEESYQMASLQSQLDDVNKQLDNIVQAIAHGIYSSTTQQFLERLEKQKAEIESQITEQQLNNPVIPEEQILFTLFNYRKLDVSTKEGRQKLVDSFVNSIYLYDDKFVITFNYKNQSKTVSFEEIESSSLTSSASPKNVRYANAYLIFLPCDQNGT